jgi:Malectin domain
MYTPFHLGLGMTTTVDSSRESKELQKILASGLFDRSPMLAQLLKYVCTKYFEGDANSIKEYSIAVDVLGRSSDFDPKKDSVIRVQFHRLREKLNEYYANAGENHPVRIIIPHGHYAPQFVFHEEAGNLDIVTEPAPGIADPSEAESLPSTLPTILPERLSSRVINVRMLALVLSGFAILGLLAFSLSGGSWLRRQNGPIISAPIGDSVRILAGLSDGNYTDGYGHVWVSDRFFHGGVVAASVNHPIWGTRDPRLYQSWRQGTFSYDLPAKPGTHD